MLVNNKYFFTLLLFILGALLVFSCNRKASQELTPPKLRIPIDTLQNDTGEITELEEEKPEIEIEDEVIYLVASLRRTGCFGQCPSFEIKLYSDGRLSYRGYNFVDKVGLYEAWGDGVLVEEIRQLARTYGYFRYEETYPVDGHEIQDLPSTISQLNLDGQEKKVVNNFDSPKGLREFEKALESLLDGRDWKRIGDGN